MDKLVFVSSSELPRPRTLSTQPSTKCSVFETGKKAEASCSSKCITLDSSDGIANQQNDSMDSPTHSTSLDLNLDSAVSAESEKIHKLLLVESSDHDRCQVLFQMYLETFRSNLQKKTECVRLNEQLSKFINKQTDDSPKHTISDSIPKTNDNRSKISDVRLKMVNIGDLTDNTKLDTVLQSSSLVEESNQNKKLDDITHLKEQFKDLLKQYELRERHFLSLSKSRDIEFHLTQAKYEQYRQKAEQEKNKAINLKTQMTTFSKTEAELRNQLSLYIGKFREVESTLNQSNELFQTFRQEIEQMGKKTRKLEKENANIRIKYEAMNKAIVEMAEERKQSNREVQTVMASKTKLESLCRALQEERKALLKKLIQHK
ncbi:hypothetical protein MT418_006827 [Batrachochytrium dendrobatidis]